MQAKRNRAPRWRQPGDELVLAAVDRADRHRARFHAQPPVALRDVADHLDIRWNAAASRRLRSMIERLELRSWLARSRVRGGDSWALTDAGRRQLADALIQGVVGELPESPQHREWRAARDYAAARIEDLREELAELLATVGDMVDADEPIAAAAWLACGELLRELTGAIGVANYCLYERAEPDDAVADRDDGLKPSALWRWRHPRMWDPGYGG